MSTRKSINRRQILKGFTLGLTAGAFAPNAIGELAAATKGFVADADADTGLYTKKAPDATVSLVKGNERREIVYQSLKRIEDQIIPAIGDKKILVKPNFVSTKKQLAATHVDAIRAILDFVKPHAKNEIIVGESTAQRVSTFEGYKNYGYMGLEKEYGIKLVDLNKMPFVYRYVFGKENQPIPIRVISTFLDPELFIISAACLKTHDRVVATLSLKNVLLAAPLNDGKKSDKGLTHTQDRFQINSVLHYNMFHLAQEIFPDLAVIDGFTGMQGNGPVGGTPYESRVALASMDAVAADVTAMRVMGFDPAKIMYLNAMNEAGMGQADVSKIAITGTPFEQCLCKFRPADHLIEPYGLKV